MGQIVCPAGVQYSSADLLCKKENLKLLLTQQPKIQPPVLSLNSCENILKMQSVLLSASTESGLFQHFPHSMLSQSGDRLFEEQTFISVLYISVVLIFNYFRFVFLQTISKKNEVSLELEGVVLVSVWTEV
jgi:hypothetical protein